MADAFYGGGSLSWFDRRITLSGLFQIVLLIFTIFKFSSDLDKRVTLLEETKKLHEDLIRSMSSTVQLLSSSNQRVVTILEQYQRNGRLPEP